MRVRLLPCNFSGKRFRYINSRNRQTWMLMTLPPSLSSVEPPTRTAAAERMRRHRQRRRDGFRCLIIELRETEIDVLIRKGLLPAENRQDYASVQSALYAFLDDTFGELRDA